MHVTVITPPAPVVTWADADAYLNLSGDTTQQARVEALIDAATEYARKATGCSIGSQTLEVRFHAIGTEIDLPFGPVTSIVSIKYLDSDNVEQTLANTVYQRLADGRVVLKASQSWPSIYDDPEAVRVQYVAGDAPKPIEVAILALVAHWNEHRETVNVGNITSELPLSTVELLSRYKAYR